MRLAKEGFRYQSNEKWPAIILMLQMFPIPTCAKPRLWISDVEGRRASRQQTITRHLRLFSSRSVSMIFHDFQNHLFF